MYLQWDCPSNNGRWESVVKNTFCFKFGCSSSTCTVMLGWVQIQVDLTNVQKLSFFQATLRSFPDGKSQMRLYHDHRGLPPAQPGPKDVTQQSFHQPRCFVLEPEHFFQKHSGFSEMVKNPPALLIRNKTGGEPAFSPKWDPSRDSNQ